jgi:hypothetical protein
MFRKPRWFFAASSMTIMLGFLSVAGSAHATPLMLNQEFKDFGTTQCMMVGYGEPGTGHAVFQGSCSLTRGQQNSHWDFTNVQVPGNIWGHIVNKQSGSCLAPSSYRQAGSPLIVGSCTAGSSWWRLLPWTYSVAIPGYHLVNRASGMCAAIPGGSLRPGTSVIQWPCGTWRDHLWWVGRSF